MTCPHLQSANAAFDAANVSAKGSRADREHFAPVTSYMSLQTPHSARRLHTSHRKPCAARLKPPAALFQVVQQVHATPRERSERGGVSAAAATAVIAPLFTFWPPQP